MSKPIGEIAKKIIANLTKNDGRFKVKSEDDYEYILTTDEEEKILDAEKIKVLTKQSRKFMLIGDGTEEGLKKYLETVDLEKIIEKEKLFKSANVLKHYKIEDEKIKIERKQKELEAKNKIITEWDATTMFNYLKYISSTHIDPQTGQPIKLIYTEGSVYLKIIKAVCFFLSTDERYKTELDYSFEKGLLMRGFPGLGKSFIPLCLKDNPRNPIKTISMIDVADSVRNTGFYNIDMGDCTILNIDDVGTEEAEVNYFGTKINWFKNFIETVDLKNPTRFKKMIFSTNYDFKKLTELYGFRVVDRLRYRMNILDLTGESIRVKK